MRTDPNSERLLTSKSYRAQTTKLPVCWRLKLPADLQQDVAPKVGSRPGRRSEGSWTIFSEVGASNEVERADLCGDRRCPQVAASGGEHIICEVALGSDVAVMLFPKLLAEVGDGLPAALLSRGVRKKAMIPRRVTMSPKNFAFSVIIYGSALL